MKHLGLVLILLSMTGCAINGGLSESTATPIKAVYLIQARSELTSGDLQSHHEIAVVQTFDDFKKYAQQAVALWIDKSATPFTPE